MGTLAFTDFVIPVTICFYLFRKRKGLNYRYVIRGTQNPRRVYPHGCYSGSYGTYSLVNRTMLYIINTGLVTRFVEKSLKHCKC